MTGLIKQINLQAQDKTSVTISTHMYLHSFVCKLIQAGVHEMRVNKSPVSIDGHGHRKRVQNK